MKKKKETMTRVKRPNDKGLKYDKVVRDGEHEKSRV